MSKKWLRLRTFATILMTLIGVGMLVGAWFALGHVSGEAVVDLAFLGLVLPIGFYGVFTLVGWQRSLADGATPGPLVGWCLKHQMAPFAPIALMLFLLALTNNLGNALESDHRPHAGAAEAFDAGDFQASCVTAATQSARKAGSDPGQAELKARIASYCSCLSKEMQARYTEAELVVLADQTNLEKDAKYNNILESCARESGG